MDTRGATWPGRLKSHIEAVGRSENCARAGRTPVLDVRVQPGGQNAPEFSDLQRFADTQGVTLRIAEFPKP